VSFDLLVWDADRPPTIDQAKSRFDQLCADQDATQVPSVRVTAFVEESERRWPSGPENDPAPFTGQRRPSGFMAQIAPEEATALYGEWAEMAERHGLVLYDPQSGMIKIPSRLSYDAQPSRPTPPKRAWFGMRPG